MITPETTPPSIPTNSATAPDFAPPGATIRINTSGWFAGGQVGCDYQFAPNWVIGIEGSGSGADIKGSAVDSFFNGKNESLTFHAKTDWFASATARVGVTWDRWMLYAKGGAAWAGDKYSALGTVSGTCATAPCAVPFDFTASETRTGWTAGVGIEWAFWNNWSARLEYDHYDFGTRSVNLSDPNFTPTFIPADIKQRFDTVRLGINYRFGWGKAPVVARY